MAGLQPGPPRWTSRLRGPGSRAAGGGCPAGGPQQLTRKRKSEACGQPRGGKLALGLGLRAGRTGQAPRPDLLLRPPSGPPHPPLRTRGQRRRAWRLCHSHPRREGQAGHRLCLWRGQAARKAPRGQSRTPTEPQHRSFGFSWAASPVATRPHHRSPEHPPVLHLQDGVRKAAGHSPPLLTSLVRVPGALSTYNGDMGRELAEVGRLCGHSQRELARPPAGSLQAPRRRAPLGGSRPAPGGQQDALAGAEGPGARGKAQTRAC